MNNLLLNERSLIYHLRQYRSKRDVYKRQTQFGEASRMTQFKDKSENADKQSSAGSLKGATVVAEKESAGEEVATSDAFFEGANYTAVDVYKRQERYCLK